MCFGLGEALTFEYWLDTNNKFPIIVINGFDFKMEERLFNKFNIKRICHNSSKLDTQEIINCIDKNNLVMLDVDRYYLDYLNIEKAHFGFHSIIIIGYKIEYEILYWGIIDGFKKEIIWYPDKNLCFARTSTDGILKANNKWYEFDCNNMENRKTKKLKYSLIKDSINNLSKKMLFNECSGINSLVKFSIELSKCAKYDNNMKDIMKIEYFFLYRFIKEFEYTGTLSRGIYAKFLKECSEIYNYKFLKKSSINMHNISNEWKTLSQNMLKENDMTDKISLISSDIMKICKMEKQLYEYLEINTE